VRARGSGRGAAAPDARPATRVGRHAQPLLRQLHQPVLDVGILGDVEGRLAGASDGADVRAVLGQDLDGLEARLALKNPSTKTDPKKPT
jgi:hypothetical protein